MSRGGRWLVGVAVGALSCLIWPSVAAPEMFEATVVRVVDGNTVEVLKSEGATLRVYLVGVAAPVWAPRHLAADRAPGQPYAKEARRALKRRVLRQSVQVMIVGQNSQGHSLGILSQGGTNINRWLVQEGWAWFEAPLPGVPAPLRDELEAAEREARRAERGLWRDPNPEPPWAFRQRTGAD